MGMMGSMDSKTMCDTHKEMMNSKSPVEREAMMDQTLKSMAPDVRRQHLEMMSEMCKS